MIASRTAFLAAIALLAVQPAAAARRALLIGVSQYAPGIPTLEGPQPDAESVRRMLISSWGFSSAGIHLLLNKQATRSAILESLDSLGASVQKGDFVFIFFSGHGTSWYAPGRSSPELDASTGAIVSSDGKLVFGKSDIQPRLKRIDQQAEVFVVFDSCYSGSSVKSVLVGTPKYAQPVAEGGSFGSLTAHEEPYPYRNVIYLSAASKAEMAVDIPSEMIAHGYHTIDGRPHGAMTDAFLEGLAGAADTDRNGQITYAELYQYVKQRVSKRFNQTPQLLYAAARAPALSEAVFSARGNIAFDQTAPVISPTLRVRLALGERLDSATASLKQSIAALPGATIATGAFDLLVKSELDGWGLYHGSGTLIQTYWLAQQDKLIQRIAEEPQIRRLIDTQYSGKNFNLDLRIEPDSRGFYRLGETLSFSLTPDQDSYLLLVNVDVTGIVTILYPRSQAQAGKSQARETILLDQNQVVAPTGTEFLKAFAFAEKPPGFDSLLQFVPTGEGFRQLLEIVAPDLPGRAQATLKLVTSDRKEGE